MINLLPPAIKKERRYEALNRQVMFVGEACFSVLVVAAVLLALEVWFADAESGRLGHRMDMLLGRDEARQTALYQQELQTFRTEVERLHRILGQHPQTYDAITGLVSVVPQRIRLTSLTLDMEGRSAIISGIAPTRADLLELKSVFEKDSRYVVGQFPLANLLKESDIAFTLSLTLTKPS